MNELVDIGSVIEDSGVPASTLHVWERAGLIAPADRAGLRRQYSPDVLDRIALIVIGQRAGFSLRQIGELFEPDAFADGKQLLEAKLEELRKRQEETAAAIHGLEHAIACPSPSPIDCPTFQSMLRDVLPT